MENERKLTVWPSELIEGTRLCPLDGEAFVPFPILATASAGVHVTMTAMHVLRTKIFSTPFVVLARLDASEANATNWPEALMLGCSLRPLPGIPATVAVETRVVEGTQVVVTVSIPVQVSRR